ncbi:hypothetical protein DERP_009018 [Dermatophagoides pteronyssinus]|uniref:Uncharacterized protein n=1 Tax=Dermatophagoides pteronyssinus TaxID=6956 RepID=A0ABQ8JGV3_DERPT|nr:hypothetical protein DERP_009018 [Dermatophagoides pteronyssinus]
MIGFLFIAIADDVVSVVVVDLIIVVVVAGGNLNENCECSGVDGNDVDEDDEKFTATDSSAVRNNVGPKQTPRFDDVIRFLSCNLATLYKKSHNNTKYILAAVINELCNLNVIIGSFILQCFWPTALLLLIPLLLLLPFVITLTAFSNNRSRSSSIVDKRRAKSLNEFAIIISSSVCELPIHSKLKLFNVSDNVRWARLKSRLKTTTTTKY